MPTPRKFKTPSERQRAYRMRQKAKAQLPSGSVPAKSAIPTIPSQARWNALSKQALTLLHTIQHEMEDYFDERTETWQEGERADQFTQRLELVEAAIQALEDLNAS